MVEFEEFQGNFQTEYDLNREAQLAKYLIFIPIPFTKKIPLMDIHNIIKSKLETGSLNFQYFSNFFHKFIFHNDRRLNSCYNGVVLQLLDQGDETLYKELTSGSVYDNDFEPYYEYDGVIMEAIKRFEQRRSQESSKNDDIPF